MTVTVDIGQVLTAVTLGLFAFQARAALREIRALRLDVAHLQRWAIRWHKYETREEAE